MTSKRRPTKGDRVRLLSLPNGCDDDDDLVIGAIYKIDYVDSDYTYLINGFWVRQCRVELVEDEQDQHAPGAKLDAGKPRVALVLAKALSDLIDQDSTEGMLLKLLIEELNDH